MNSYLVKGFKRDDLGYYTIDVFSERVCGESEEGAISMLKVWAVDEGFSLEELEDIDFIATPLIKEVLL